MTALKFPNETGTVPSAYAEYTRLAAFWDRLGWTAKDIDERPRKQVQDFLMIMRLQANHEQSKLNSR